MNVYYIVFEVLSDDTKEIKDRAFHHSASDFETVYSWSKDECKRMKEYGADLEIIQIKRVIDGLFTCPDLKEVKDV